MVAESLKAPLDQSIIISDGIFTSDTFEFHGSQIAELARSFKYKPQVFGAPYIGSNVGLVFYGDLSSIDLKNKSAFEEAAIASGFNVESTLNALGFKRDGISPDQQLGEAIEMAQSCDVLVVEDSSLADSLKSKTDIPIVIPGNGSPDSGQGVLADIAVVTQNFLDSKDATLSVFGNLRFSPRTENVIQGLSGYPGFGLKFSAHSRLLPSYERLCALEEKGLTVHRFGGIEDLGPDGKTIFISRLNVPDSIRGLEAHLKDVCKVDLKGFKQHVSRFPDTVILYPTLESGEVNPKGLYFQGNPAYVKEGSLNMISAAYMLKLALSSTNSQI